LLFRYNIIGDKHNNW